MSNFWSIEKINGWNFQRGIPPIPYLLDKKLKWCYGAVLIGRNKFFHKHWVCEKRVFLKNS
jgi:hypothetical protein